METSTEKLLIDTLTTLESIRVLILSIETTPSNEEYFNNVLDIEERDYLDITLISFSLFIIYLFICTHKENKNFFDKYFNKHYDTIVY